VIARLARTARMNRTRRGREARGAKDIETSRHRHVDTSTRRDVETSYVVRGARTHSRNGKRNPRLPIEKLTTGGHSPVLNKCDTWSIVPSPPIVRTSEVTWPNRCSSPLCVTMRSVYPG
jgi:hypothetical protein